VFGVVVEVLYGEGGADVPGVGWGELGEDGGEGGGEAGFPVYEGAVAVEGEGFEACEVGVGGHGGGGMCFGEAREDVSGEVEMELVSQDLNEERNRICLQHCHRDAVYIHEPNEAECLM
jgi:hypothetical protein